MLHAAAVFLCLACFLHSFDPSQCRSTGRVTKDDNQTNHIELCLEGCFLLTGVPVYRSLPEKKDRKLTWISTTGFLRTSSRQTCSERCLGGKLEIGGRSSSTSGIQHLNPLSRRRKRNAAVYGTDFSSLCPRYELDINILATIRKVQRQQYENSNTWYVNISWDPVNKTRNNFTGYAFILGHETKNGTFQRGYFKRAKNETYVVYNESENGWKVSYGYFGFEVITLPCLSNAFHFMEDLSEYLRPEDPTVPLVTTRTRTTTTTATATTTKRTTTIKLTTSTTKSTRVLIGSTVTFGGLALIAAIVYLLRRKCDKESIVVGERIPPAGLRYDAFIIFNQKDQKWVESKLLRILEDDHGFKCCVHYRDFEVGACFLNNISNSLEVSRKVIAVVSKNFFTSNWCNHELAQALYKQAKGNDNSIIVIRKDDVNYEKLPVALKDRSFIDYSNTVERKTWVSKLVKALECSSNEESLGDDNADIPLYPI